MRLPVDFLAIGFPTPGAASPLHFRRQCLLLGAGNGSRNDLLEGAKQTRLCARHSTPEHSHPSKRLYIILRVPADRSYETEME